MRSKSSHNGNDATSSADDGAPALTASAILDRIECLDGSEPGRRIMFREFPLSAGGRGRGTPRIDALVVHLTNTYTFHRTAYEVKVNRRDFELELANPSKRERAQEIADQFYFAAPYGLIDPRELPDDCGLLGITPGGGASVVLKSAAVRPAPDPDWPLIMDFVRRAFQLGQEDTARRRPLPDWPSVHYLAQTVADPLAGFEDRDYALKTLEGALYRHGRKGEARDTNSLRRHLRSQWPDRDKDLIDLIGPTLSAAN